MFAVFAERRAEPGEPGTKGWFGFMGAFRSADEARAFITALQLKNGYSDVRICDLTESTTATK